MADSNLRLPRYRELADSFTAECLLMIVRHRNFEVSLTAGGDDIQIRDVIPAWLWNAIHLFRSELLELMQADFLGSWRS